MRVRLIGEHDIQGRGRVPDGTIIEHKDAHLLVKMKRAEEVKEPAKATDGSGKV